MKSKVRILFAALLAVGMAGVLLHFADSGRRTVAEEGTASPIQQTDTIEPRFNSDAPPVPPTSGSRSGRAEAESDVPLQESAARPLSPSEMASNYAKSMQTGVFSEELMPEFAEYFLFPTERSRRAAAASQSEFLGSSADPWSSEMEQLLRTSFGRHPSIANVRISVACRVAKCELQFVERTVSIQPNAELGPHSVMLMANVAREEWFRQNFVDWRTVASTPVDAEVAYQRIVLSRRHQ
jgi:hypothetical protein